MLLKFKHLVIKHPESLEKAINDYIEDKEVLSIKVDRTPGSINSTHEVYITYMGSIEHKLNDAWNEGYIQGKQEINDLLT